MSKRRERFSRASLDEHSRSAAPEEATPSGLAGREYRNDERLVPRISEAGRFVREVREPVYARYPAEAAGHLVTSVYVPFEQISQEEMWVLLLNARYRITHEVMVYRGTVNTTCIRVPELLKDALKVNAPALILSHCHPSGDPTPSPEDITLTQHARLAAQLLDLDLLDHIIVGKDAWISLREQRLAFE